MIAPFGVGGANGARGASGADGANAANGADGASGADGARGADGANNGGPKTRGPWADALSAIGLIRHCGCGGDDGECEDCHMIWML
jgi:hypothetical protein